LANITRTSGNDLASETESCEKAFAEAMDDDLNISAALAEAFEFIRKCNRLIDDDQISILGAQNAANLFNRLDQITGLFHAPPEDVVPDEIEKLVKERTEARRKKDFARADAIRNELAERGWLVEDTPDGPRVKRKG